MKISCIGCGEEKDESSFTIKDKKTGRRLTRCHVCQAEYNRDYYAKNSDKAKEKVRRNREKIKEWYVDYKSKLKCSRCPENHPACLQFHHVDGDKEAAVSKMVADAMSKERILVEIAKCVVLCANCHFKEHAAMV